MKTAAGCVLPLILLAAPAFAAVEREFTPETAASLRAARTVSLEIKQNYTWLEEENVDGDKAEKAEADEVPKAKGPRDLLPLAELTAQALGFAGWKVAAPGVTADLRLVIETEGRALGAEYIGTAGGHNYSGAELNGSVTLFQGEREILYEAFSAEQAPPRQINRIYYQPWDAPFARLLPDFLETIYRTEAAVFGLEPLLIGLKEINEHRPAAARVIFARGDATVVPALLTALRSGEGSLGAIAAAGLGVFGDASTLPALLDVLREDPAYPADPATVTESGLEDLLAFDFEPENEDGRRVTAVRVAELPRHQAVEWALLHNPAPDKVRRLAAVLRDRQYPPLARRGAALVLGRLKDPQVEEALLAALQDEVFLVRCAAVSALNNADRWSQRRVADAVLALTTDSQPLVRTRARAALGKFVPDILTRFLNSKYGSGAAAYAHLEECLGHPDPLVRLGAVRQSVYAGEAAVATLEKILRSDPVPVVRDATVEVLADRAEAAAEQALVLALADGDEFTRHRALVALDPGETETDGAEPSPPLPEAALAPLLAMADSDNPAAEVWRVIKRVQGAGVVAQLLEVARRDNLKPALREITLTELGRRRAAQAAPLLLAQLALPRTIPYEHAVIEAAIQLDDPAMLDPLFALLTQGAPEVRLRVVRVLGGMSHTRAAGPLIAALRRAEEGGQNWELAEQARAALRQLTGQEFAGGEEWLRWWKENAGRPIVRPPVKAPDEATPPEETAGDPSQN